VSKAAEKVGLGQPAVSNALARLRKLLGDELFLRTSTGMQPTPFAAQLAESIGYALGMIHGAINARTSFDPATSQRSFSIGMTDIGEIYFRLTRFWTAIRRNDASSSRCRTSWRSATSCNRPTWWPPCLKAWRSACASRSISGM